MAENQVRTLKMSRNFQSRTFLSLARQDRLFWPIDAEIQALAISVDLETSIPEGPHAAGLASFFNTQFKWHNSNVF
jgi:hypothetical protein